MFIKALGNARSLKTFNIAINAIFLFLGYPFPSLYAGKPLFLSMFKIWSLHV